MFQQPKATWPRLSLRPTVPSHVLTRKIDDRTVPPGMHRLAAVIRFHFRNLRPAPNRRWQDHSGRSQVHQNANRGTDNPRFFRSCPTGRCISNADIPRKICVIFLVHRGRPRPSLPPPAESRLLLIESGLDAAAKEIFDIARATSSEEIRAFARRLVAAS